MTGAMWMLLSRVLMGTLLAGTGLQAWEKTPVGRQGGADPQRHGRAGGRHGWRIMHKLTAFWLVLCLCLGPHTVSAAQYDGSVPLLCAVIEVLECEAGAECQRGDAESVNLPPFVKVDVPQKVLSTTEAAAEHRKTPIRHVEQLDGQLTLQGGEGGRAWSLIIAEGTGKLTATITDDQVGFVIFGACTPI